MKKTILSITLLLFSILILLAYGGDFRDENNNVNYENEKDRNTAFKVVIDPGHGGTDGGATGASGQYEKDFALGVSKKVEKLLEQEPGIQVFMTRTDDSFISSESRYRPRYANELNADLFLSIHGNTVTDPDVTGTETYFYHKNSRRLAKIIQKHVVEATGYRDRGIKEQNLFVVKDTEMPAALIEVGYLTNPHDEFQMWTDDFQDNVATSIVEGIKEYKEDSKKTRYFSMNLLGSLSKNNPE
ncbi:N-acetylmuramoyl-L-alanine amidase family protein [Paenibacillus macquariensis]|uniref:N-acetylmuramoyl-L-alanine amidase n=2 Tax=Paenibacillus macquariensis TaxID=948756 RepID=A0ABY1K818_9BACL|nr:N-acetylmuramoyl-L-alanine amidase [Paenibacillus macquariensis]MEC0091182.1 N-acetylmuramoyl-L-alanine amidase [Paenibacillus macquariensis]OAB33637.1 cell wall hydrolase [Paenibacillus macquariensis subsp. macquariensis]SIR38738.1 N-acetylmuramoyl-L-alanine amidase [Paenibacillus macquariensis]